MVEMPMEAFGAIMFLFGASMGALVMALFHRYM